MVAISFITNFVLFIAPCIDDLQYIKPLTSFIDEQEIDAAALYYTDIEEFSIAELNMKNTIDYVLRFTHEKERELEKIK